MNHRFGDLGFHEGMIFCFRFGVIFDSEWGMEEDDGKNGWNFFDRKGLVEGFGFRCSTEWRFLVSNLGGFWFQR